jgi:hypothetical protein
VELLPNCPALFSPHAQTVVSDDEWFGFALPAVELFDEVTASVASYAFADLPMEGTRQHMTTNDIMNTAQ